jgi:hypothetical protein
MDQIFNICVDILIYMSKMLGISYEALNVLLFVIIHPVITLMLFILCIRYRILWKSGISKT